MKRLLFLSFLLVSLILTSSQASAQFHPGSLIWSQTSDPSPWDERANGVAVDSTGVYIVGYYSFGPRWRMEKRSLVNGSLTWFQTNNPSGWRDGANGVAVDSTGVYIVGYDESPGYWGDLQWHIEKRNLTDGSLMWIQTNNPSLYRSDRANGVAVDSTGIYIVGFESYPGNCCQWRIEKRRLGDGSLIWSQISVPSGLDATAYGVAVDSTGVYIVGYDCLLGCFSFPPFPGPYNSQWRIEKRRLGDGSLIWSQTSNPSRGDDRATGVAVDTTGVYTVGLDNSTGNLEWRIEKRRLGDGSLIWSQTSDPSPWDERANGVAVDSTGVYIVGYDESPGYSRWRIEKRNLGDGSPIWNQTGNPNYMSDAYGVAVDSGGVYVVGYNVYAGYTQWRIEKRVSIGFLTIITESLLPSVLGQFSSHQLLAAGGTPPYLWSLANGSLPRGTNLHSDGVLNGTAIEAGNFTFTARVTDANNNIAEKTFTKEVLVTLPPPQLRVRKTGTVAVPGRILDYFIIVENLRDYPVQNVVVDEYLDTSLFNLTSTYPPAVVEGNESYPVNIVSWNIPTLAPLEMKVLSYRAKLNASTSMGTEVVGGPVVVNTFAPPSNQTGQGSWRPIPLPIGGYKIIKNGGFRCIIREVGVTIREDHAAVDLQAAIGTPVSTIAAGEVFYVGDFGPEGGRFGYCPGPLYGQTIIVRHDNNEYCLYAHLNATIVQRNQRVVAGQLIGYSGISGAGGCAANRTAGYGPHLHFGCFRGGIRDGDSINPCDSLATIANPEKCTCAGGDSDEHLQNATRPIDPNEKEVVANRFIKSNQPLVYPIHFENIGNVSALDVFVDGVLDRNIDYSTVQVLSPNGTFNPQTGIIRWELLGINLEPNATGVVMFSAMPNQGLQSGITIRNNATIQFEIFERITTNTVENIIDDINPSCTMRPLPNITASQNFTVSWSGTDPVGEIDSFTIFASIDDGALNQFVSNTRQTNATFFGEQGRTYRFICIATDTAGNVEIQPPVAEAQTRIPGASLQLLGVPRIGTTVNLFVSDWAHPGNKYVLALSLGASPGIPLGDGRVIPLNPDMIFLISLQAPQWVGLRNNINLLDQQGQGTTYWDIPNIPELNGITVYAAFVVLDHTLPIPFASISNAVPITIRA